MQALPGFRDFYPEDFAFRASILKSWRATACRYGFVEYDGPPLESLELYTEKSGEEIAGQLYHFVDKGERQVALRAEMTPTLARMVGARARDFRKPLKWFSIPQVFRYERAQKGRLREHFQFNADIMGEPGLGAEVELLSLVIDVLRDFGLEASDFVVRISDRQFWADFLKHKQVPPEQWYEIFQAIDKSEREPEEKTRERLGELADEVLGFLKNGGTSPRLETIQRELGYRGLSEYITVDFRIVRGLAYYTGIVFEVFDRAGEFRAIAGGGRYDDLLSKLGSKETMPALGFGMGDVVLGELLKARGKIPPTSGKLKVYLVIAGETQRPQAMELLQALRTAGFSTDYALGESKIKKQFESAEQRGAETVVIVDGKLAEGMISVKKMASREQIEMPIANLISYLGS